MLHRRAFLPLAALLLATLPACPKKSEDAPPAKTSAPAPPPPPPAPRPAPAKPAFDVPFQGKYSRTAKVTYKNGQRVRLVNAGGTATMTIEAGKVTYAQTYQDGPHLDHVTQIYTFTAADMRPVAGGGYDVALTFQKMDADTKNYSPDSKEPKIEARRQGSSWEIGFLYRDTGGIQGGIEFR
jgi:hypothetical protein